MSLKEEMGRRHIAFSSAANCNHCMQSSNVMRKPISISVFIETSSSQHQKGNVKALIKVPLKTPGLDHGAKITLTVGAPYL